MCRSLSLSLSTYNLTFLPKFVVSFLLLYRFCLCIYFTHCTSKPIFDRPKFTKWHWIQTHHQIKERVIGPKTTVFLYFCLFNRTPRVCGKYTSNVCLLTIPTGALSAYTNAIHGYIAVSQTRWRKKIANQLQFKC